MQDVIDIQATDIEVTPLSPACGAEITAFAGGAAIGAVRGVKDRDKKEVAEGAAAGALAAYLMESGRGHEIDLPKGAKLELELERALYLLKE